MACFIKLPSSSEKGIITFTSIEYDNYISKSSVLYNAIFSLKKYWIMGLHHNSPYANCHFIPDALFDFYMGGPGDLVSPRGLSFYQIKMDCSNFCPDYFADYSKEGDKWWDLLFISRNVFFKSLDDFFVIIRRIFDKSPIRVLGIIVHENLHRNSKCINTYLKLFTYEERKLFTLMTPWIDYPFPFDLRTLAFYYHHSRVFLHVASDERHPRVAGYAWAAGLPVVAPTSVGSLLLADLQKPPGFYAYRDVAQAVTYVQKAIDNPLDETDKVPYREFYLDKYSIQRFKSEITKLFHTFGLSISDNNWLLDELTIRLARHHTGRNKPNFIPMNLHQLSKLLKRPDLISPDNIQDFEIGLYNKHKQDLDNLRISLCFSKIKYLFLKSLRNKIIHRYTAIRFKIYRFIFKLKFAFSSNRDILFAQIDRTFEHLNLNNAIIHTHRIIEQIDKYIKDKNIQILAVGCCNTIEIDIFKKYGYHNITGIDLISFNKKYISIMDMHKMRFRDNSFDMLYCSGTFHCTYNPEKVASEFIRVLKSNGIVCITVPINFPLSKVYRYDPNSLNGLHSLFSKNINKIIWNERVNPKSELNPHANVLIRTIFTIKK